MTPKISVIVPIYNVEAYLPACLDSLSSQTFQNFELILVDDGSSDRSGVICDDYAAEHPNTRVLHQANAGVSQARNNGVATAQGEYIAFIDSDDLVTPDYLEYLLDLAEKYHADISCGEKVYYYDGQTPVRPLRDETERRITVGQALSEICYNTISICLWSKLFKRSLLEKHAFPVGQLYEDIATTYKLIGDSNGVVCGNRVIYFWRQRPNSITHAAIDEQHFFGITAAEEMLHYVEQHFPEALPGARTRVAMKCVDLAYRLVMGKTHDRALFERIRAKIRPLLGALLQDSKNGLSLKARSVALRWGYLPFRALSLVYHTVADK